MREPPLERPYGASIREVIAQAYLLRRDDERAWERLRTVAVFSGQAAIAEEQCEQAGEWLGVLAALGELDPPNLMELLVAQVNLGSLLRERGCSEAPDDAAMWSLVHRGFRILGEPTRGELRTFIGEWSWPEDGGQASHQMLESLVRWRTVRRLLRPLVRLELAGASDWIDLQRLP